MKILKNISLKAYNTFNIDVKASDYAEANSVTELLDYVKEGHLRDENVLILGGGSNILFSDDFDGLVIRNRIEGIEVKEQGADMVLVKAGAGVVWDDLVHYCIDHGYGGIENLVLIPGSVGASPIQNIGAYGVELKDVFHSLEAVDVNSGEIRSFGKEECAFAYRDSIFKKELKGKYIILSVSLMLSKDHDPDVSYGAILDELKAMGVNKPGIQEVGEAVTAIRQRKLPDPEEMGNAGSFFKNPVITEKKYLEIRNRYPEMPSYKGKPGLVKVPAGWMIEQCAWKGKTLGNAGVHDRQALVLVNKGNATGKEVLRLARRIKASVFDEFGIDLEMEVNVY
jgi:UDP-N-acetylmuramate dehydrogenase